MFWNSHFLKAIPQLEMVNTVEGLSIISDFFLVLFSFVNFKAFPAILFENGGYIEYMLKIISWKLIEFLGFSLIWNRNMGSLGSVPQLAFFSFFAIIIGIFHVLVRIIQLV